LSGWSSMSLLTVSPGRTSSEPRSKRTRNSTGGGGPFSIGSRTSRPPREPIRRSHSTGTNGRLSGRRSTCRSGSARGSLTGSTSTSLAAASSTVYRRRRPTSTLSATSRSGFGTSRFPRSTAHDLRRLSSTYGSGTSEIGIFRKPTSVPNGSEISYKSDRRSYSHRRLDASGRFRRY